MYPTFPGDRQLLLAVQEWRTEALDAAALTVSLVGWWPVSVVLVGLLAGGFLIRGRRRDALMASLIPVSVLVSVAAGYGLKLLVQRLRPEFLVIGPAPGGFSFPSGHALFAALLGGAVVLLAEDLVRPRWLRRALQGMVVLMALAVGASRVYLGAHWPSDVLGGYLVGVLAVCGLIWLRERLPTI
jgi:undecaprenyl-diphosphatase